jgi:hypothetical protein
MSRHITAQHEAGHAVAMLAAGHRPALARVHDDTSGKVYRRVPGAAYAWITSAQQRRWDLAVTYMAGPVAEAMALGWDVRDRFLDSDNDDFVALRELVAEDHLGMLQDTCANLLEEHATLHQRIAGLLRDGSGVIHGDDLLALYVHHTRPKRTTR